MVKVAIYTRVSTQEQDQSGYSIGEQRERLVAYCKAKNYVIYDVYVDGGYSGANLDRPGLQKLKSDIGKYNLVLVYKLDRLSRSQFDILDLIENTFLPNGIDFVSMSEAFDTSTPFGRAMIGILGVFAQLEREQIRERTIMGRKARAKEGKHHGSSFQAIGYDYIDGKLVPHEYEAEQIRLLFQMVADNKSNKDILDALNKAGYKTRYGSWKSSSRISKTLKNNVYIGTIKYDDIVIEDAHEPLISKELYEKANAMRSKRKDAYGKNVFSRTTMLSGLIWCAKCDARYGTTISRHKKKGEPVTSQNRYHACYSRAFPNSKMAKTKGCPNKIWRIDTLEALIGDELRKISLEQEYFEMLVNVSPREKLPLQKGFTKRLSEIDKQISKLVDLFSVDSVPLDVVSSKIDELNKERNAIQAQLENETKSDPDNTVNARQFHSLIKNALNVWSISDIDQKRLLLSSLIKRVVIDDEVVSIEWALSSEPSLLKAPSLEVECPECGENKVVRYGKASNGKQRYQCKNDDCKKSVFLERE